MTRWQVARIDELDEIPVGGHGLLWRPIRRRFGITGFGINAYTCHTAGEEVVEAHDELGTGAGHHEELYVVVSGHARFTLDGEEIDAPAGTLVLAKDPAVKRQAIALEPGTTVLAIGGETGAVKPSPWEHYFAAIPLVERGDYAGAAALCEEGLEQHPGNGSLLYNLACYRSLGGDVEGALSALREALEAEPRAREWARTDPDFDALRDNPEVAALLAHG